MIVAEALLGQSCDFGWRELLVNVPAANGSRGDAEVHIREGVLQRLEMLRRLHDIRAAFGPPLRRIACDLRTRAGDRQFAESEILHRPRGGADVSRLVRLD